MNHAKPDLDLIDPRRSNRCAVEGDVRIVGQPVAHLRSEVRTQVVHHDMNLTVGVLGGDGLHEREKLF